MRKEGHTDGFLDLWLGPRRRLFLSFTAQTFNLTAEKQTTDISIKKKRKKRRIHLRLAFYHKTYG